MAALLLLLMCHYLCSFSKAEQAFLREPFDQIATVGEHVTLPCRVVNKRGVLQWTRDDFGLGTDRNLTGYNRYKMSGSDEEGDYTLDINPVDLEDDAQFQCQIGAADGVKPIRSRYATLTVLVPPEPPKLMPTGDLFRTVEGRQVELRCESRGGKPASEITWMDDRGLVLTDGVRTVQELMDDGKRYVTISILKFVAGIEHHGRNFTCQAQNSANRHPASVSTRLQVHYPPHVTLSSDKGDLLEEGERVRFSCSASANPSQLSYAWYVGGRRVADAPDASTELVLDHVDRRLHNHLVKCEVTNPIGRSEQTAVLNIAYAPMFVTRPTNAAGMPGDKLTLSCEVDANPRPSYKWYKVDPALMEPMLVGSSSNLTIEVSAETAGRYECVASAKGGHYAAVKSQASIFVKSKPDISIENRVQKAALGGTGQVHCQATCVPTVQSVEWFDSNGQVITGEASDKFQVQENRSSEGVKSTLIIRNVNEEDFTDYTCKVTNAQGTDVATFHLQQQASVPTVIVLSGIIGGLVLTVVVILVVLLLKRSKNAPHSGGCPGGKNGSDIVVISKDINKGSDGVSNNSSEMKVEVRTSSSLSNGEDCWEGSDDSGPRRQIIMPKTAVDYVDGSTAKTTLMAATLPPYNKADAPKFHTNGGSGVGNYGYYHSNTTGNYGSYNHAFTASPSQNGVLKPTYDNFNPNEVLTGGQSLNIDKPPASGHLSTNRYSLHVRASPISPTYSQFSSGVSVKNAYPSTAVPISGNGYGGGGLKNASFDYVPSDQLRHYNRYSVPDNYAVYVNSTSSPLPTVVPIHEQVTSGGSTVTTNVSPNSVKAGSLATHV